MADRTPAFDPPMNSVSESGKDPMIVKVDEDRTDWGARKSQQPDISNDLAIKHVMNGR